jgi:anti-sigma factor RsiW
VTDPMNAMRFAAIVDAYGADRRHWPEEERDAAVAWLAAHPEANSLLDAADMLDAALFAHCVAAPSPELRQKVMQGAPGRRLRQRIRLWLTALAFGLAAGGGIFAGSAATAAHAASEQLNLYDDTQEIAP